MLVGGGGGGMEVLSEVEQGGVCSVVLFKKTKKKGEERKRENIIFTLRKLACVSPAQFVCMNEFRFYIEKLGVVWKNCKRFHVFMLRL